MSLDTDVRTRSWFCVYNNPQNEYPDKSPEDIAETVIDMWCDEEHLTRTGAVAYCISADGLIHLHMVLEDAKVMRFPVVKKVYPKAHIEATKGNKEQAEDYILKRGKHAEKGEQVLYIARRGEIKGAQGARKDLEVIGDLIEQGKTPNEIMRMCFSWRKYDKMIRDAFYDKRYRETPVIRDVIVEWHVGDSGSGKTYVYKKLCDEYGEDMVYMLSDYDNGGLDRYCAEPFLFMDEFRGQIKYGTLLAMLQGYKQQIHARYANVIGLWNEVHIATVFPPEKVYEKMVEENQNIDTQKQLFRRISVIVYHWKDESGYHEYRMPFEQYVGYEDLKQRALGDKDGFVKVPDNEPSFGDI